MAGDLQPSSAGLDVCAKRVARGPLMPDQLNLSQSAWVLLDLLQQQLGVTLDVLDASMRPLTVSGGAGPTYVLDRPETVAEIARSMKTGEVRIERSGGAPVVILPLRVARQIVGCLLVSSPETRAGAVEAAADARLEGAGHLARTALESDLTLTTQLADARYRTRRAHGILRFLLQLGTDGDNGPEMMNAIVQAAAVWFDIDCRIYEHQPDGSFVLASMLPGADQRGSAGRIDAARAEKLLASRRFSSAGDLEDLGLAGRRDEVLVLPVGTPAPRWLLVLTGTIDEEVERTFAAIARVVAGVLQARDSAGIDVWQQRLAEISDDVRRIPERVLPRLLEALASEVGATCARVTLRSGGAERALAALGCGASPGKAPKPSGEELSEHVRISQESSINITLTTSRDTARRAAVELRRWTRALQPWLCEVALVLAAPVPLFEAPGALSPFESRIQEEVERAKRFNLGLGLVLIGAERGPTGDIALETLLAAVRPELRASDLLGRVRAGLGGVLLMHAEPVGADVVVDRLRQRLEALAPNAPVSVVQLGRAMFSADLASADALIAQALRQAQSVVLRN
jgi:hypothetical protein